MAARPQVLRRAARLGLACAVTLACGTGPRDAPVRPAAAGAPDSTPAPAATRIVSLVPSITETLFAIGAGSRVVGVSSFDKFPPDVERLPRVGALLDPDTERILSLRPDLVAVYGSQTDVQARLEAAGIRAYAYRHGGIETGLETTLELGAETGHAEDARRLVAELRSAIDGVRMRVAGRPRPRTLLVMGRQPGTLQAMYASGGVGFLHELLEAAGGRNVYADVAREAVQPTHEGLLAAAPDVVIEIAADGRSAGAQAQDRALWAPLGTIPAVRTGRLHFVAGAYLVVPGPRMSLAVETLARVLHPEIDWPPESPK